MLVVHTCKFYMYKYIQDSITVLVIRKSLRALNMLKFEISKNEFLVKNVSGKIIFTGIKKKPVPLSDRRGSIEAIPEHKYKHDNESLALQVEALQSQLQEQTKLAKEQVEALIEDRKVKEEEMQTRMERDEAKIATLTEK